jgi:hypothetical protein
MGTLLFQNGKESVIDQFLLMICAGPASSPIVVPLKKTVYNIDDWLMPLLHKHLKAAQGRFIYAVYFSIKQKGTGSTAEKRLTSGPTFF